MLFSIIVLEVLYFSPESYLKEIESCILKRLFIACVINFPRNRTFWALNGIALL